MKKIQTDEEIRDVRNLYILFAVFIVTFVVFISYFLYTSNEKSTIHPKITSEESTSY